MHRAIAIAAITFLQGVRTQTFRIVGLLFVGLLAVAWFLRALAVGQRPLMLRGFGLTAMEISALLLVVIGFVASYYRERETRIQAIHLTYVSAFDHTLGRLLGNITLLAAYLMASTIVCGAVLWFEGGWNWSFLLGSWSILLKLSVMCAFAGLFCSLFSSSTFASLMTIFTYLAAEYAVYPLSLEGKISMSFPFAVSRVVYHILPNFDKIDLKYQAIHGEIVGFGFLIGTAFYTLLYIIVVFLPTWQVFARHEH